MFAWYKLFCVLHPDHDQQLLLVHLVVFFYFLPSSIAAKGVVIDHIVTGNLLLFSSSTDKGPTASILARRTGRYAVCSRRYPPPPYRQITPRNTHRQRDAGLIAYT